MPSVDKARSGGGAAGSGGSASSMYPLTPPISGPPPPMSDAADSALERGSPHHSMGPYSYGPPPYGYHPHHAMAAAPMRGDKSAPPPPIHAYGPYPGQHPPPYGAYGGAAGYLPPYGTYGGGAAAAAAAAGTRGPPPWGYEYPSYPSQHSLPAPRVSANSSGPTQPLSAAAAPPSASPPNKEQSSPRGGGGGGAGGGRSSRGGLHSLASSGGGGAASATAANSYAQEMQQPPPRQSPPKQRSPERHGGPTIGDADIAAAASSVGGGGGREALQPPPSLQSSSPQHLTMDDFDRAKMQAAAELSLAEVRPIQTDFHFFVQDHRPKLLPAATAEVENSLVGKSNEFIARHRLFLINSNLNCRILKAWEDLPRDEREEYFKKEEDDRQRFMEEDEVAGRHCFTLTARIRSPSKVKNVSLEEDDEGLKTRLSEGGTPKGALSPSKATKTEPETDMEAEDEKTSKRFPDAIPKKEESPSKKNKGEEDWT
jgi:hypothetical protein